MNNIVKLELNKIVSFKDHPFHVIEDEDFEILKKSVTENGLLNPLIVRPIENNMYEMISGHRRKQALMQLGIIQADVIIKNLSDNDAIIYMVDSNIYREKLLPSEKAFAYKMKYNSSKHRGKSTSDPEGPKLTIECIKKIHNESSTNIKRYIRLTYLIPSLLELVDNSIKSYKQKNLTMGIRPAVELSYLNKTEQELIYSSILYFDLTPSHAQM